MHIGRFFLGAVATAFAIAVASPPGYAASQVKANFSPVPTGGAGLTYDGGTRKQPGVGPNDTPQIPTTSGCPLPGIGACGQKICTGGASPPNTACATAATCTPPDTCSNPTCSMTPGGGVILACGAPSATCEPPAGGCLPFAACGGAPCCVEVITGPDGIKVGDMPVGHLGSGKGKCQVKVKSDGGGGPAKGAAIKCQAADVLDAGSLPVTTIAAGTCHGGPNDTLACTSSSDCGDGFFCESGDEYHCQVDGITGSNADNSPPCGPCLAVLVPGLAGTGCGVGGPGACIIGTCPGGPRIGQACDILGNLKCPGGFLCDFGAAPVLTGDETGFFAPDFGGMAYQLCPFKFHLDFPLDLSAGAGKVQTDITGPPISTCLPHGAGQDFKGCFLHEPGSSSVTAIEFFTGGPGSTTKSCQKEPCTDVSLPLPESSTGLPTSVGVGPIIGVTGPGPS